MSYLAKLDSALRFNDWRDTKEVFLVLEGLRNEGNLTLDERLYLLEVSGKLLECDYIEFNPVRINYPKLREFLDIGEELYFYLEQIGIE